MFDDEVSNLGRDSMQLQFSYLEDITWSMGTSKLVKDDAVHLYNKICDAIMYKQHRYLENL